MHRPLPVPIISSVSPGLAPLPEAVVEPLVKVSGDVLQALEVTALDLVLGC